MRAEAKQIMAKVKANIIMTADGCWMWQRHCNALGYGTIWWGGRSWMLTRLVYSALRGVFDPDLDICHTCDHPGCARPEHIWADEHQNNLLDASRKKRLQGQWKTHCKRGHPLEGDNLYVCSRGLRHCNECTKLRARGYWKNGITKVYQKQWRAERRAARSKDGASQTSALQVPQTVDIDDGLRQGQPS